MKPVDSMDKPEYFSYLDFSKNKERPEIAFNIVRNETLVQEMKERAKKKPKLKRPNMLVLIIDSLSRPHFFRKMPKTAKYFEQFFKKEENQNLSAYQFFRYHGVREHHNANLIALRYDDREYWEALHPWERFENNYKDEGYITATASAKCEVDEIDIEDNQKSKQYADRRPLDYEFFGAACDPNAMPTDHHWSTMAKGPFSEFRRCIYGKDSAAH